jgi:pimeloyl-ACP methyl ester carboxylesterase
LFLNLIPHAKQVVVKGAGHFLQETHGELLAENVIKFIDEEN